MQMENQKKTIDVFGSIYGYRVELQFQESMQFINIKSVNILESYHYQGIIKQPRR